MPGEWGRDHLSYGCRLRARLLGTEEACRGAGVPDQRGGQQAPHVGDHVPRPWRGGTIC